MSHTLLRVRTEHSYHYAVGKIDKVLAQVPETRIGIVDRAGTWGHVKWAKAAKRHGKVPIFGVELAFVPDMEIREKGRVWHMSLLARTDSGLAKIYELVTLATEKFYYEPRLDFSLLPEIPEDVIILSGHDVPWGHLPKKPLRNFFVEHNQLTSLETLAHARERGYGKRIVATVDNLYPTPQDIPMYQVAMGQRLRQSVTIPRHILAEWEMGEGVTFPFWSPESVRLRDRLGEECSAKLPSAKLVHPEVKHTLRQLCVRGAKKLGCDLKRPSYKARLDRELNLIEEKKFEDYFFVVEDMVNWAKERMLVGPARGSSCGSLVCYLLGITDIDPLPFDLLFERFIDVNREDLPDIDIDFQDDRRELVFEYVRGKYGHDNVARLGTVNVWKAKSALSLVAKELSIPTWEVNDLKNSIIERSSGDSRAAFCILDTFNDLDIGRKTLGKYPELALAAELEAHASHTGMHSAGILITAEPIVRYCAVNAETGTAMLDKKDAESLNLLKIDALGLRTLSVLQDTLDQIGMTREQLKLCPTNDKKAFKVLNDNRFAGVFQFEGYALQSLSKQLTVAYIEDIIALSALARPGPLNSGGSTEWIKRRTGKNQVEYLHPLTEEITKVTYGVIVYQEQVMQIARTIGSLSWADVSELRKAMSKSLGKEFFDGYWQKFWEGARDKNHLPEEQAKRIWDNINTMGSWAFNRSHAVAYGLLSYWCCWLKANHPLEFGAACLRNARDEEQSVKILRELVAEGYEYKPFDPKLSQKNWSVQKGRLVGGLTAIKGVGDKLADSLLRKRANGNKDLTKRERGLLDSGVTPWDNVFQCAHEWGHIIRCPRDYGIETELCTLASITDESDGTFVFIAKLVQKNLRDHNEIKLLEKRGGKKVAGQTLFLQMTLEDDTASILSVINRFDYTRIGLPIIEEGKIGDWYLWKGRNSRGYRKVRIDRWKKLTGNPDYSVRKKVLES